MIERKDSVWSAIFLIVFMLMWIVVFTEFTSAATVDLNVNVSATMLETKQLATAFSFSKSVADVSIFVSDGTIKQEIKKYRIQKLSDFNRLVLLEFNEYSKLRKIFLSGISGGHDFSKEVDVNLNFVGVEVDVVSVEQQRKDSDWFKKIFGEDKIIYTLNFDNATFELKDSHLLILLGVSIVGVFLFGRK